MGVLKAALCMRFTVLTLSSALNYLIEDYDTSVSLPGSHVSSSPIGRLLSGLAKWDSLFFLEIAHNGYLYEKNHAFFPLYPLLIRLGGYFLSPLESLMPKEDTYLLSAVVVSWVSFVLATHYLQKLGEVVFGDRAFSNWSALLFVFNPASIFMSSVYTTSLFTFLSLAGIYYLLRKSAWDTTKPGHISLDLSDRVASTVCFACATATRSNGSLLFVFPLYHTLCYLVQLYKAKALSFRVFLKEVVVLGLGGVIHALPVFLVLGYGYSVYCGKDPSPYCSNLFPNIYSYIQSEYWEVGFMRYWQLKQIPNFILPAPILYISLSACVAFTKYDPKRLFTCGLKHSRPISSQFTQNPLLGSFIFYWSANLFILVFVANVQIATRMLASVPCVYWWISGDLFGKHRWVLLYFLAYLTVGTALFSNFYPWT